MMGVKKHCPAYDRTRSEEQSLLRSRDKAENNPVVKQSSPRLGLVFAHLKDRKCPPEGINRALKKKRKERITLPRVSIQQQERE